MANIENVKIRHTFHIQLSVLEKLRDTVRYIQNNRDEFEGEDLELIDNLSRFAETAFMEKIMSLESRRGKRFPSRKRGQGVHFGRPPASETSNAA